MTLGPDTLTAAALGALTTIVVAVLTHIAQLKLGGEATAKSFATTEFLDKLRKIDEFIKHPDTQGALETIKNIKPCELVAFNRTYREIEDRLKDFGDNLGSMRRIIEAQVFNEVNGRIHSYIEANTKFIKRLGEAKGSKKYLANSILSTPIMQHIIEEGKPIFIESGSTFAYLMLPLIDYVNRIPHRRKPMVVCTNNVTVYILLLFEESFSPVLLPGKPTNQYGATFGDPIQTDIFSETEAQKFLDDHKVTTILSTASFLDVRYGPHVSSFANWQMKRFLNKYASEHNCKHIFVITSDNINNDVQDHAVKDDCKLIFYEPSNEDNEAVFPNPLSDEDLQKVYEKFSSILMNENNYIITGSADKVSCNSQAEALKNNFARILTKWTIVSDQGQIAVLSRSLLK